MLLFARLFVLTTLSMCVYCSNSPQIKHIHGPGEHYEGPHWTPVENALYWVDIKGQQIHRLDSASGNVTTRTIGYGPVPTVVTVKDNPRLILTCVRTELFFVNWESAKYDSSMRLISAIDLGLPDNRCNDGKVDAKGRFWIGTMGKETTSVDPDQGSLYLFTENNYLNPEVKVKPVSISNGIAWTKNNKYMFYIDTPTKNVDVFDFNLETGQICNRRTFFSFTNNNVTGLPDGMTIDTDGNLWIACFNGGKVIKVNSVSGKLLEQHKLPVSKITSVMFGGNDLSTLYVTTSRVGLTTEEIAQQPEAGSLFAIEGTGAKGRPEHQFIFKGAGTY